MSDKLPNTSDTPPIHLWVSGCLARASSVVARLERGGAVASGLLDGWMGGWVGRRFSGWISIGDWRCQSRGVVVNGVEIGKTDEVWARLELASVYRAGTERDTSRCSGVDPACIRCTSGISPVYLRCTSGISLRFHPVCRVVGRQCRSPGTGAAVCAGRACRASADCRMRMKRREAGGAHGVTRPPPGHGSSIRMHPTGM